MHLPTLISNLPRAACRFLGVRALVKACSRWAWSEELRVLAGVAVLKELHLTPGKMEAHIQQSPETAQWVAHCFAAIVAESPNYTEMRFDLTSPVKYEWITVTVQKGNGKTPHTLRTEAEAACERLRKQLMACSS